MIEREEMNYDDFTLRDVNRDELSGSLAPFTLVVVTLFLSGTGLLVSYSSSYDVAISKGLQHYYYLLEMVTFGALALITGVLVFFTKRKRLEKCAYVFYPISLLLMLVESYIAINGKEVAPLFERLNASDILIFTTVWIVATAFPKIRNRERRGWWYLLITLAGTISIFLMVLSGKYTYAILYFLTLVVLFKLSHFGFRFILFYSLFTITIFAFLFLLIPSAIESVFNRLMFLDGNSADAERIINSLNAVREGGFLGKGFGNGYYKLSLIDGVEGDYVSANIIEELGILGALLIFLLFMFLFILGMRTSNRALESGDEFVMIASYGFTFVILFKAILSCFVTLGLFPSSGISMPFFSANGFEFYITILECAFLYRFTHITGRSGK